MHETAIPYEERLGGECPKPRSPDPLAGPVRSRALSCCIWLGTLGCLGVVALMVLWKLSGFHAWDDAYMFVRYADNLLAEGKLAWNPGGEATYGLTSPLYLLVVVPFRLLAPGNAALAIVGSSLLSGAAFLALLVLLLATQTHASPLGRRALVLLGLFAVAVAMYHMLTHFVSGMDTLFALAYLTAYIVLAKWHERAPSGARAVLVGVLGGLAYFVRPDLMLYAALVPLAALAFGPTARHRKHALLIGAITAGVLAGQMAFAHLYFGTALPLPFYAKSLTLYGPAIRAKHRLTPVVQLAQYAVSFWFPLLLIAVDFLVNLRNREDRRAPVDLGLLVATVLFVAYYLGFVLQIMYMGARFYYPTLPAILFLAAQSAARLTRRLLPGAPERVARLPRGLCWLAAGLLLYTLLPPARVAFEKLQAARGQGRFARFSLADDYDRNHRGYWFALDTLSTLPDDVVLAATEIGRPGVLNPTKTIIDLTGLNDTRVARQGFDAASLLDVQKPDLIYMPHPDYTEMAARLVGHPTFARLYEHFTAEQLSEHAGMKVEMGVALRRDSPRYAEMRAFMPPGSPGGTGRRAATPE